jgi:hypothetical protein
VRAEYSSGSCGTSVQGSIKKDHLGLGQICLQAKR